MEPNETELQFGEEQFVNRTGVMNNPELSAELIRGAEEMTPSTDAPEPAEIRAEYLEEDVGIGSDPVPEYEHGFAEQEGLAVLLDKLGERLAFERQGTRLYEGLMQKFEATLEDDVSPSEADLRHICDEEFEHFKMLQQAIVNLGGDATVQTPSADVAGVLAKGAVEIVSDPRTTIAQCLQAMLTAELADNDGWQMLRQLAGQLGLGELEEQCRNAFEEEQEHLENVRNWLLSMTLGQARGGDDVPALESDAGAETEAETLAESDETEQADTMDVLELLKHDHERVKELFEQAEATGDDKEKRKLFKVIKKELETHTRVEEAVFYPAMKEHEALKDMVLESIEEHKQVKKLLREMDRLSKSSDKFEPKLKLLQENVEHHAVEEEEGKMFPKIRELFDSSQLEELGAELEAAKSQRQRKAS
jgi:hemerythrin superfamily protein